MDTRYSDSFRGIMEFSPTVKLSYTLAVLAGVGVLSISLAFAFTLQKNHKRTVDSSQSPGKGSPTPRKSSVALSGALRHAMLSIRRGGARSLLVPVLCAAALLFVSSLQATLASYDAAQEALYENTELIGYCAEMNGKYSDKLSIQNELAKELVSLDYLSDQSYVYTLNYVYLGTPLRADGSTEEVKPVPDPQNPYEMEILNDILKAEPNIVFTDSVRNAPEFYFNEFHGDFMPGWDETRFPVVNGKSCPAWFPLSL